MKEILFALHKSQKYLCAYMIDIKDGVESSTTCMDGRHQGGGANGTDCPQGVLMSRVARESNKKGWCILEVEMDCALYTFKSFGLFDDVFLFSLFLFLFDMFLK